MAIFSPIKSFFPHSFHTTYSGDSSDLRHSSTKCEVIQGVLLMEHWVDAPQAPLLGRVLMLKLLAHIDSVQSMQDSQCYPYYTQQHASSLCILQGGRQEDKKACVPTRFDAVRRDHVVISAPQYLNMQYESLIKSAPRMLYTRSLSSAPTSSLLHASAQWHQTMTLGWPLCLIPTFLSRPRRVQNATYATFSPLNSGFLSSSSSSHGT